MSEIKQPQDRKTKTKAFEFTGADGESYTLPLASTGVEKMSGGDLMDAALAGEVGQVQYLFKVLMATDPEEDALAELRALKQDKMLDVIKAWGEHGDGDGASLGK